ncbi:hypothetical protein EYR27_07690 [Xanthomonas oryzae]|nr:hypothetical protein EYR27_07690 [Xanthomonas oryzae]
MDACVNQPGWASYFRENMNALFLPAPDSLYGNVTAVNGAIVTLVGLAEKFGPRITVMELIKAGTRYERFITVAGLSASWYLGAVIGSAAVATGRHLACGTTLTEVLMAASQLKAPPDVRNVLVRQPIIYKTSLQGRSRFAALAKAHGGVSS